MTVCFVWQMMERYWPLCPPTPFWCDRVWLRLKFSANYNPTSRFTSCVQPSAIQWLSPKRDYLKVCSIIPVFKRIIVQFFEVQVCPTLPITIEGRNVSDVLKVLNGSHCVYCCLTSPTQSWGERPDVIERGEILQSWLAVLLCHLSEAFIILHSFFSVKETKLPGEVHNPLTPPPQHTWQIVSESHVHYCRQPLNFEVRMMSG